MHEGAFRRGEAFGRAADIHVAKASRTVDNGRTIR
jgi:hypothetical protein